MTTRSGAPASTESEVRATVPDQIRREIADHFRFVSEPVADSAATIVAGNARFTILTSRLIRLEYHVGGRFEDRPSQAFWFRKLPVPVFRSTISDTTVEIITDHLHLTYRQTPYGFTPKTLAIRQRESGREWHFGDSDEQNLGGTVRTLDGCDGSVALPPGLMSRSGWAIVDDSASLVFNAQFRIEPRLPADTGTTHDLYFFGYGAEYQQCLIDFCTVAGRVPMVPRWLLGNWWSRYWEYSHEEMVALVHDFRSHEIPLSVCVIDMDWHLEGWTGYTWNKKLFPDPAGFVAWLHEQGLRTALNLHPHDGVGPHEEVHEAFARSMGRDPSRNEPIEFDIGDPEFTRNYFELLHHPLERTGIDFWWLDWQQGEKTKIPGLDPLWLLNHLHYLDLGRDGVRRPFIFSRWGAWGNHRYPIGFSGDTVVTWASLAFQPYLTATASNVGFTYWSHDIGGHMLGSEDAELYIRWIQFGVFSPILRIHSTKNEFQDRRPWVHGAENLRIAREFLQLRHALIPYMYTMNHRGYQDCLPLVRPMYYESPHSEAAYECPGQYWFGTELIVAPVVTPADRQTNLSRTIVWLPKGDWHNFFTGEYCAGDRLFSSYGNLDQMPVFAKAGAIVPLGPLAGWGNTGNPSSIDVHVFAGADNVFELYEDDGETIAYTSGVACLTRIAQRWSGDRMAVSIGAIRGAIDLVPPTRHWRVIVSGVRAPHLSSCHVNGRDHSCATSYDPHTERLTIDIGLVAATSAIEIGLDGNGELLLSRRDRRLERCRTMIAAFSAGSDAKTRVWNAITKNGVTPETAPVMAHYLTEAQIRALCELLLDAGYDYDKAQGATKARMVLWNNSATRLIQHSFASVWGSVSSSGPLPAYLCVTFDKKPDDPTGKKIDPMEKWSASITWCGVMTDRLSNQG